MYPQFHWEYLRTLFCDFGVCLVLFLIAVQFKEITCLWLGQLATLFQCFPHASFEHFMYSSYHIIIIMYSSTENIYKHEIMTLFE